MPPKKSTDTEDTAPVAETLTLRLKQNAFWRGVFHSKGDCFTYPRAEALNVLATCRLFETV